MKIGKGSSAPNFCLLNTEGEKVSLSDFKGKKNVVLLFFPLAFSRVCTEELCTIRDNLKLYSSLDAEIVGISVDSFFTLKAFKKAENLNFILLSDFNKEVSGQYGSLYDDYYGMKGVSKRSAFVMDKLGIIKYSEVLEDDKNLPSFEVISNVLTQL